MTITAANSQFCLSIASLFTTPQRLSGYSADDAFAAEAIECGEVLMGVDGRLAGGIVRAPIKQTICLQADSPSNFLFDTWYSAEQQSLDNEKLIAAATIELPATNWIYTFTRGFLTSYTPMPAVKRVLQARHFVITWQSVTGEPT